MLIDNKIYTKQEYKDMDQLKLIKIFNPLILKLAQSFGEDRFAEDVKQECILELLKRQKEYEPNKFEKAPHFPIYILPYIKMAAKRARQMNFGSVYVPYSSMVLLEKNNKVKVMNTFDIEDFKEDTKLTYSDTHKRISQAFSILKIILIALKKSEYSKDEKIKIKDYLRDFLITGKSRKILNERLNKILKNTCLSNYFSSNINKG